MPDIAWVTIDVEKFRTKKQQTLLKKLNSPKVQTQVNTMLLDAINKFVPKKSGALRASGKANSKFIYWGEGLPYARYQYYGQVYGPNHPIVKGGTIVGWYSTPGKRKHPTGRELGVPGYWKGWKFGYTTRGTRHHWDQKFRYLPKMKTNLEITRYLKRECKKWGLKA